MSANAGYDGLANKISLPPGTSVYVSGAIRNLLVFADCSATGPIDTWINIPDSCWKNWPEPTAESAAGANAIGQEFEIDENSSILPIVVNGDTFAALAGTPGIKAAVSDSFLAELSQVMRDMKANNLQAPCIPAEVITRRLFRRDQDLTSFYNRLFTALHDCYGIPIGGLYYGNDEKLSLRVASGPLAHSDKLTRSPDEETIVRWRAVIADDTNLTPVSLLPADPEFLTCLPYYFFVQSPVATSCGEGFLVLVVPGDISVESLDAVREVTRLVSLMDEAQFSSAGEIASLYDGLKDTGNSPLDLDRQLMASMDVIQRQFSIVRLGVVVPGLVARQITIDSQFNYVAAAVSGEDYPKHVSEQLEIGVNCFVTVKDKTLTDAQRKKYVDLGIETEMFVAVTCTGGCPAIVSIGSCLDKENLSKYDDLATGIARFLGFSIAHRAEFPVLAASDSDSVQSESNRGESARLLARFDTVRRLSSGFFHDIRCLLAVVVGYLEIRESKNNSRDLIIAEIEAELGTKHFKHSIDEMTSHLSDLQNLCSLNQEQFEHRLSCAEFLKNLPALIYGYARKIRDQKNVTVELVSTIEPETDIRVSLGQLYDTLVPFVLGLMEAARFNGRLDLVLERGPGGVQLRCSFKSDMIAEDSFDILMRDTFAPPVAEWQSGEAGILRISQMGVTFAGHPSGRCTLVFGLSDNFNVADNLTREEVS